MSENPFEALLQSNKSSPTNENDTFPITNSVRMQQNKIIEDVFYFTVNKLNNRELVFLEDLAQSSGQIYIDLELLEQAVFERILLESPEEFVINKTNINTDGTEKRVLIYLRNCFIKLMDYNCPGPTKSTIRNLIIRNVNLALKQPDLFVNQNITIQLQDMFKDPQPFLEEFFFYISNGFSPEGPTFSEVFTPLLNAIQADIARASLVNLENYVFTALDVFSSDELYANAFWDHCKPANPDVGFGFANTIVGALFSLSILPKTAHGKYEYFDKPLDQSSSIVENNLWISTKCLNENIHRIFLRLLKCSKTIRKRTLNWLAQCLKANVGRGKLWNTHLMDFNPIQLSNCVSDGFMINMTNITLKLCQPFCKNISSGKILKVDPTYCAVDNNQREAKDVHLYNLSSETCLIPVSSDENSSTAARLQADSYSFMTECFYLAHRTLDLGFRVLVDHLLRMNQEIGQIQRAYNDAINQTSGNSDVLDSIKLRLDNTMTRYRSTRAVLLEPHFLTMLSQFHKATATWLTQVCVHVCIPKTLTSFAPITFEPVTFPLPEEVPETLKCIPEFLIENTVGYLSFLRRFYPQALEEQGYDFLDPILVMVLTFMGSPQRMRNPHLRARMAECLEALLPYHKDVPPEMNPLGKFQREKLFKEHPHRKHIVRNLLDVFVSIEMTGQSVQFEQKFNYRRPMYTVMDYLWLLDEHRDCFKQLALEAQENMDAVLPPLFLRFVNLLMNDAVFLLDESLTNMAQLRTSQTARENGEWDNLSQEERTQNLSYMQHIGMIARFDNILGRETIHILTLLTSKITIVFTHSTMVDRVAAMLNYFLFNLVGPKKKNFKVKDQKEYEFDPANTVLNICKIYEHLGKSDAFCIAVSQDGRSYSPQLFTLAEDVLIRIGGGGLISKLQQVATKVSQLATQQKAEEEVLAEAPDEFLDPIMSTLMTDPVILPSSKQIVDRTTIARHLLSDQTDPFNRSPLSMDQVIPDDDLCNRIKQWITERHKISSK